ncbi:hypothetical protein SFC07_02250 [Corynebacterium callunae]|uniref:hypothetical protein n=1 Tax=Corynebacterium callunae TaxID=1721 RepID=UPI003982151E
MRSFRTAAVAGVAAIALSLGSTTIASAEESDQKDLSSVFSALSSGGPAAVGEEWDADLPATGNDIFGEEESRDEQPAWVQNMYDLTWIGGIATLLGVIVFPAYNYLVYTGVITK